MGGSPEKFSADPGGSFRVRFFLHGLRHLGEEAIRRASRLQVGQELRVMVELNNPATRLAVTLLTSHYGMIGWAPRSLVEDLIQCVPNASRNGGGRRTRRCRFLRFPGARSS